MIALICLSGRQLWKMSERYVQEAKVKNSMLKYRQSAVKTIKETTYISEDSENSEEIIEVAEPIINQFIINLQNEVNPDIAGWLTIPDTKIDYPFVTAADNNYYLRRDVFGNYAMAGSLFMDYRCSKDLSGFNSIIYGHNMKNGSMFGELNMFDDESFFEENKSGTIFLKNHTYKLEIFAYMVIKSDDGYIYNYHQSITHEERDKFYEYVKKNARNYREPGDEARKGNIITLSTCISTSESNHVRIVLLANIIL